MEKIEYLQKYFNGPKQGSQEWLNMRVMRFGGSEMKDFEKINKLIAKRSKETSEDLFCWWGKWFESVVKMFLGFKIYEFGAIPCAKIPVAYSPDGLFESNGKLWLLEIKCPIIKEKINIKDYEDQVQTGMYILPVDKCLLIVAKFKRCYYGQLGLKKYYDARFHKPWFAGKPYRISNRYKSEEIWYGVLVWDAPLKEERHVLYYPNQIKISKEAEDILDYIDLMKTGYFMCFKCFELNKIEVSPTEKIKEQETKIWTKYSEFLEQIKTRQQETDPNTINQETAPPSCKKETS